MTWLDLSLSRRTFIFSTATAVASFSSTAAIAASIFKRELEPLHVAVVGFGGHARRFLDAVSESALCVDVVFDPDAKALESATALLRQRQAFLPELVRTSDPSLNGQSSIPVLLCSPPDRWDKLVPRLTKHGRPVLAHHTQLFGDPYWPNSLRPVFGQDANLLVVGSDPGFPIRSINSFHTFARSRGTSNALYRFFHSGWSSPELLALHFDCLNAALPQDICPQDEQWQFLPMPTPHYSSGSAFCSISTTGPGIAFGANLEIAQDASICTSSEYSYQFADFCRSPQYARDRVLRRQSALLEVVCASREPMSLFM